jgi:beta-hydroxylase
MVEAIPSLETAGFSLLKPKTHIRPHKGKPDGLLRCHLGLLVPDRCGIRVGEEHRTWEEGHVLIFDDSMKHEAWNQSESDRVVLLLDFSAPDKCVNPPEKPKPLGSRLVSRVRRKLARLLRQR